MCKKSNYAIFAIAAALAGPVLDLVDETESIVFNYFNESSGGKTTLLLLALSVYEKSSRQKLVTFRHTERGLEEYAAQRNSLSMAIDELSHLITKSKHPDRAVDDFALLVSGGRGNQRSNVVGNTLPNVFWKMAVQTTANHSIKSVSQNATKAIDVRWQDIHIPDKERGGIFDIYIDEAKASPINNLKIIKDLETNLQNTFGSVGVEWIEYLVAHYDDASRLLINYVEEFIHNYATNFNTQQLRVARKFAIVYATATVATQEKFMPVSEADAQSAVLKIFSRYIKSDKEVAAQSVNEVQLLKDILHSKKYFPSHRDLGSLSGREFKKTLGFRSKAGSKTRSIYVYGSSEDSLREYLGLKSHDLVSHLAKLGVIAKHGNRNWRHPVRLPLDSDDVGRKRLLRICMDKVDELAAVA